VKVQEPKIKSLPSFGKKIVKGKEVNKREGKE
jgi:hypothetical protein